MTIVDLLVSTGVFCGIAGEGFQNIVEIEKRYQHRVNIGGYTFRLISFTSTYSSQFKQAGYQLFSFFFALLSGCPFDLRNKRSLILINLGNPRLICPI